MNTTIKQHNLWSITCNLTKSAQIVARGLDETFYTASFTVLRGHYCSGKRCGNAAQNRVIILLGKAKL